MCSKPYVAVSAPANYTLNGNGTGTGYAQVYMIDVPIGTGHIFVSLNSSDDQNTLSGANFGTPTGSNYNCILSSYSFQDMYGYYIYDMFCYTPRAGSFYIINQCDNEFNGSISFDLQVCGAGMGGYNCTYSAMALNVTAQAMTYYIPYDGNTLNGESFMYFYIDNANYTGTPVSVMATSMSGSGYMYVRKDGFNEDSSTYGYETSAEYDSYPAQFVVNGFDFYVPGRWYFGLSCSTTGGCNVTFGTNTTTNPITTGIFTTGMMNTTVTTGMNMNITTGMMNTTVTTGMNMNITTGMMNTTVTTGKNIITGKNATTGGVTTGGVTTGMMVITTGMNMTEVTTAHESGVNVIVPSILSAIALVAALFILN